MHIFDYIHNFFSRAKKLFLNFFAISLRNVKGLGIGMAHHDRLTESQRCRSIVVVDLSSIVERRGRE